VNEFRVQEQKGDANANYSKQETARRPDLDWRSWEDGRIRWPPMTDNATNKGKGNENDMSGSESSYSASGDSEGETKVRSGPSIPFFSSSFIMERGENASISMQSTY
jgi:hypothetical protein